MEGIRLMPRAAVRLWLRLTLGKLFGTATISVTSTIIMLVIHDLKNSGTAVGLNNYGDEIPTKELVAFRAEKLSHGGPLLLITPVHCGKRKHCGLLASRISLERLQRRNYGVGGHGYCDLTPCLASRTWS